VNAAGYPEVLVVMTVAPALEEPVIDWLLARPENSGFTSLQAFGHSSRNEHLSPTEQVTGRQRRTQFQVAMQRDRLDAFLAAARQTFAGADFHYWVVPVIAEGRLGN
jgi:hypothetical protein